MRGEKENTAERDLERIFFLSPDMVSIADYHTSTFLKVNPSFVKILGHTEEELLGTSFIDFVHPEDKESTVKVMREKLGRGVAVVNFLNRYRCSEGTYKWLEWSSQSIPEEGLIYSVARDITERVQSEDALREANSMLKSLLEAIPDLVLIKDVRGRHLLINRALEIFTGHGRDEIIGKTAEDLMGPDLGSLCRKSDEEVLNCRAPINVEEHFLNKDGEERILDTIKAPIFDGNGSAVGIVGVSRDITERKRHEELLRERTLLAELGTEIGEALTREEDVTRMLRRCAEAMIKHLDAALARIWVFDRDENILEMKSSAGMYTHTDGIHGRIKPGELKIGLIFETREPHLTNNITKDEFIPDQEWVQREGLVSFAGHPLIVEDRVVGVMAMFSGKTLTEVTARALSSIAGEIALGIEHKKSEMQLKASLQEKEILIREISHRTKNNMQVITSLLNLQLASVGDPKIGQLFRETQNRIKSMALVHEKLYQSKELSNVNLKDYLQDLTSSLLASYKMTDKIVLRLEVEDIQLSIDSITPLGLVVNELMSNSVKYAFGAERGEITIKGRYSSRDEVQVYFGDDGAGLPAGFDIKKAQSLGLKLVHNLVEIQLKGSIELRSGKGTEFLIRFRETSRKKRL